MKFDAFKKNFGDIIRPANEEEKIEVIPSGSLCLDLALGVGGYQRGRIIDIFGVESGGKSTLSMLAIKEAQKMGGTAYYIDAERSYSSTWTKTLGVDSSKLYIVRPDSGEQAFDAVLYLVKEAKADLIVIDSTPALVPSVMLKQDMINNMKVGAQALMMSVGLQKLVAAVASSKTVVIFINQMRALIGNMYGPKEGSTGGKALRFYSSVRVQVSTVSKSKMLDENNNVVGHRIRTVVVKNKVAPPFKVAEFNLNFYSGVDPADEIADLMIKQGIVQPGKAGWLTLGAEKMQGKEALVDYLKKDKKMFDKYKADILSNKDKILDTDISADKPEENGDETDATREDVRI